MCRSAASKAAEDGSLQAGQQKLVVMLRAEQQKVDWVTAGRAVDSSTVQASSGDSRSNVRSSVYQLVVRSQV